MNVLTNITGLAGIVLLLAMTAMTLLRVARCPRRYVLWLTAAVAIAVCIPVKSLPAAAYLRGVVGDVSLPLVTLLIISLLRYTINWPALKPAERNVTLGLAVLAGLILYPFALGIGYTDPYRWGFGSVWFLAVLLVIAFFAVYKNFYLLAFCIALPVFAWSVHLYEANNLWNYLLDPLLVIYGLTLLITQTAAALWRLRKREVTE